MDSAGYRPSTCSTPDPVRRSDGSSSSASPPRHDPVLRNDLGVLAIWRPYAPAGERLEQVGLRLEHAFTGLAGGEDADWIAARLTDACAQLGAVAERVGEQRFRVAPARRR